MVTERARFGNKSHCWEPIRLHGSLQPSDFKVDAINNGNWTEWSAIGSEIIRVTSKSDERAVPVRFEITSMISDQNCTTRSSITYSHFEIAEFRQYQYFTDQEASLLKSGNKKAFTSRFVFETEMMRHRAKIVRFKTEMMRFRTWMTRFRTGDLWINHIAESQWDCRDHQWFQNGYNKID